MAVTNVDGGYVLYGVSGLVKLHARREGYVDGGALVPVTAHRDVSSQPGAHPAVG